MPANMMKALVASIPYVSGSSRATAMAGPMPGRTPTAVPKRTPTKANSRFMGVAAVAKPCKSMLKVSISEPPRQETSRKVDAQAEVEAVERQDREDHGNQAISNVFSAAQCPDAAPEEQCSRNYPAYGVDQQDVQEEGAEQREHGLPVGRMRQVNILAFLGLALPAARNVHGKEYGAHQE